MLITIVIGSLNRGGCETHLLQVLPRLDQSRFQVEIFTLAERGQLADAMESAGIQVIGPWVSTDGRRRSILFRLSRLLITSLQLWLYLVRRRPDAVHFFLPAAYLMGAPIAVLAGIRQLLMSRRSLNLYQHNHRGTAALERFLHRRMTALVGNSRRVVHELIKDEDAPPDRTFLIYNGIAVPQPTRTREDIRAELGLPGSTVAIVIVANLIPYKGHTDLLEACRNLAIKPDWRLLVVGKDTGIGSDLKEQATRLNVASRVQFLGSRSDVANLLTASDIGVLSSHEEGFSNAILEGMAAGLPMVVTDAGGNAEAVCDGETGIVVPVRQPTVLTEALTHLIENPELRTAMGTAGRERVQEHFSITKCVQAYEDLYETVFTRKIG